MATERGTPAPLSASRPTWHSGMCPALPYFSTERDKEDALTYVSGLTSEFSSTNVFQQWPTSGCKIWQVLPDAFKYETILSVEGLTYG